MAECIVCLSLIFMQKKAAPKRSVCLIMDEVDGIAGAEDRSGITELISIIKTTKVSARLSRVIANLCPRFQLFAYAMKDHLQN